MGPATRSLMCFDSPIFGVRTGVENSLISLTGLTPGARASFLWRPRLVEQPESDTSEGPGDGDLDCGIWNTGGLSESEAGGVFDDCCGTDADPGKLVVPTMATSREDLRGT